MVFKIPEGKYAMKRQLYFRLERIKSIFCYLSALMVRTRCSVACLTNHRPCLLPSKSEATPHENSLCTYMAVNLLECVVGEYRHGSGAAVSHSDGMMDTLEDS